MLNWITSPRSARASEDYASNGEGNDAMADLMTGEVEAAVYEFECDREVRRSQVSLQTRTPDYTWLVSSDSTQRPRKFLSMQERAQIQRACETVRTAEWAHLSSMWHARKGKGPRTRENIIGSFVQCVHELVAMRPRPQTVASVLNRYLRSQSSINAVADSPRDREPPQPLSARSLGPMSFRSLSDVV